MNDTPEPPTRLVNMNQLGRALLDYDDPPVKMLFVYNCNPLATMPDQNRVLRGLQREDLFTVVYEQVFTDTARYADVVLPATTFLEHYDIAKGYGPITLQLVRPVIEPVGEARPNADVFSELAEPPRTSASPKTRSTRSCGCVGRLPTDVGRDADGGRAPRRRRTTARRSSSSTCSRRRRTRRSISIPDVARQHAHDGALRLPAGSRDRAVPARADLAGEREDDLVDARRAARARRRAADASRRRRGARHLSNDDPVRVFNELGEVHCPVALNADIKPGTVVAAQGPVAPQHATTARPRTRWCPTR